MRIRNSKAVAALKAPTKHPPPLSYHHPHALEENLGTGSKVRVKEDLGQKLIDDLDEPLMVLESDGMTNKNEFAVVVPVVAIAPIVVAPIVVAPVAPVVVTPVEPSFIPLGRKIKQNQAE
ncbi:hypothetical protein Tco_1000970 [Tanacetum coccineum]